MHAGNSFTNKSTSRCDFQQEIFYRRLSVINSNVDFIINSIDFRSQPKTIIWIIKQIHAEFSNKY